MSAEVLHVIPQFSRGGAGRALTALVSEATTSRHRVVSLAPAQPGSHHLLTTAQVPLVEQPTSGDLDGLLAQADIVQIHFWNTPELYEFLSAPRAARVIVWSHVDGRTPPHIVTPAIAAHAHALVGTADSLGHLAVTGRSGLVIAPRTPHHIPPRTARNHAERPFTVGIFGSLDAVRSDAAAVRVFAKAALPDSRLLVVGSGDLVPRWREQARVLGLSDRVEFTGFVEDVAPHLDRMDVLLHIPRRGGSATSDLALQEAMLAGAVPIVASGTAVSDLVHHGRDGMVAADLEACVGHLRTLAADPTLMDRLRAAGERRARREFTATTCARQFEELYDDLATGPRTSRAVDLPSGGAERFVATLGDQGGPFETSAQRGSGWREADAVIADSPPALVGAGAGGILHYRGYYPDDPLLRLWAGLVFARAGRTAFAAAEFAAAATGGVPGAAGYLDEVRAAPSPVGAQ